MRVRTQELSARPSFSMTMLSGSTRLKRSGAVCNAEDSHQGLSRQWATMAAVDSDRSSNEGRVIRAATLSRVSTLP
eukprot:6189710-Pleurochrysis_carterae.AAC.5